jgi:hypothetical protein
MLYFHSPADRNLGHFQFLAITNNAAINTFIYKSLHGHGLSFLMDKYWVDE